MNWIRALAILLGVVAAAPCRAQESSPIGVEVLHTFRPRRAESHVLQSVRLVGLDPDTHRAAFVTMDEDAGARSARYRERLDVVDYRRHRLVDRITASYEVHVSTEGESRLGRFSGTLRNDIRIIRRVVHELGGSYWGHEELVVTPDGRTVVARTPEERIVVLSAHGRRRRSLLPAGYFSGGRLALTPDGRRVTVGCWRDPRNDPGLCIADLRGHMTFLESPQIVTALNYTDPTTAYAITLRDDANCLTRFDLGAQPSIRTVRCFPGSMMRQMFSVPGARQSVVRIRRGGDTGDYSLALLDLDSGAIVREMPFSIHRRIRGVLEGARVVGAIDPSFHPGEGPIRVLDLAHGRSVEIPTERFGGWLTQLWRREEGGREVVYGLRSRTERAYELVRLDFSGLSRRFGPDAE